MPVDFTITGNGTQTQFICNLPDEDAGNIPYYRTLDSDSQAKVAACGGIAIQMVDAITVSVTLPTAPNNGDVIYLGIATK